MRKVHFQWFNSLLENKPWQLNEEQYNQFELYYEMLIQWNERINLTAITDKEQVFVKHFYDSLTLGYSIDFNDNVSMIDVGSGAGFPGLPMKIAFPKIRLTIIDSLAKRISFLEHLVGKLKLEHVVLIHARAEDAARHVNLRDAFDIATARAVARLNILHELCVPFVKPGGWMAAMKGTNPEEEIVEAEYSARQLNCKYVRTDKYELPEETGERHIILYQKLTKTPSLYPRKPGLPSKKPLLKSH